MVSSIEGLRKRASTTCAMTPEDLPSATRRRTPETTGYAKGDLVRQRILGTAMDVFGEVGFKAATTRRIADVAQVQLPAIQYYFHNKEGLYLACAQEIVQGYRHHMGRAATQALAVLKGASDAAKARAALRDLMEALVNLVVGADDTRHWAAFIARETSDKGPAYEILYENVWSPGAELTARLIARIRGEKRVSPLVRVQALLLISNAMALQSTNGMSRRLLGWSTIGEEERQTIMAALAAQIAAIALPGQDLP